MEICLYRKIAYADSNFSVCFKMKLAYSGALCGLSNKILF